jgi:hypothetical protein
MSVHLHGRLGKTFTTSAGHWAVILNVARCFGWEPAGTMPPADWPSSQSWGGQYDTNDGQVVTESEALILAKILHAAAAGPQIGQALADMIRHIESSAESADVPIPEGMRMHPEHFSKEFSPLLFLLYDGEFRIE